MSSKDISETNEEKEESKLIRCENCRQVISADKLFLHEGFCIRNNKFCEHCEKVFLKEDYEEHIKDLSKNLSSQEDESSNDSKKSESHDEEKPVVSAITTTINPAIEIIQMPLVEEEYSINAPIIISNGQIVSNKNKNEYLLPFLGIKPIQSINNIINNNNNNNNNFIKNQEQLTLEKHNTYKKPELKNIYTNDFYALKRNNTYNKGFNFINKTENQLNILRDINNITPEMKNYNKIAFDKYENLTEKKNKIIINNNIITYNDNKNISKIHNYFGTEYTPEKTLKYENTNSNNNNYNNKKEHPQDKKSSHKQIERSPENRTKKLNNRSGKTGPTDNKSKTLIETRSFKEYKTANIPNKKIKVIKLNGYNRNKKNNIPINYKNSTSGKIVKKESKRTLHGQKSDNYILSERLKNQNIEEFGIEENKKKILKRAFMPPLHTFIFHREDIAPPKNKTDEKQNFSQFNVKTKKLNNEKKFLTNDKGKDAEIEELLFKTEKRSYRERKIIKINKINKINQLNKGENSKSEERIKKNLQNYFKNFPRDISYNASKFNNYIRNIKANDIYFKKKNDKTKGIGKTANSIRI